MGLYWGKVAGLCLGILLSVSACTPISSHQGNVSAKKEITSTSKASVATSPVDNSLSLVDQQALQRAATLDDIAGKYYQQGKYKKSLTHLQQALGIKKRILGKDHPDTATSYNNIGTIYRAQSNYEQALAFLKQALTIREKVLGEDHRDTAMSYNNIGMVYGAQGDYGQALAFYQQALDIQEKVLNKDHRDIAISYNNIGGIHHTQSNYGQALAFWKRALEVRENALGKNHSDTAQSYNNIGGVYNAQGDYGQALAFFQQALEIWEKILGKEHPYTATSYNNIGGVYNEQGKYGRALAFYQQALAIEEKVLGKDHRNTARSYNNIGGVYNEQGKYGRALAFHQQALAIRKKVLGKEHPDTATSYNNIGIGYHAQGDDGQAFSFTKQAFTILLHNQQRYFSHLTTVQKEQYQQANHYKIDNFFSISIDYLLTLQQQGKHNKKAEKLVETIANDWLAYKGSILDHENRLLSFAQTSQDSVVKKQYQQLIQLKKNYARIAQSIPDTPIKRKQQETRLQQQTDAISQLQYAIAQKDPRFKQEKIVQTVTAKKMAQQLPPNALYLDYAKVGDRYFILALTRQKLDLVIINADEAQQINQKVKAFRENIEDIVDKVSLPENLTSASRQSLARLYPLLLPQKIQAIMTDKTDLIISPDGALALLPFEALYDAQAGQYLIQQKTVRYIASGKELMRVLSRQSRSARSARHAVLFSHPDFNQSNVKTLPQNAVSRAVLNTPQLKRTFASVTLDQPVGELPNTAREAQQIQQTLRPINVRSLSRSQASEANLLQTRQPTILHIATHGFFNDSNPNPMLQSGLLLAGANQGIKQKTDTGIVSALKLSGMDLEGTDLVVLSACDTGTVNPDATEGVSGLTKAFIQAGAQKVVMSLWAVLDKETADLMIQFYKNSGNDPRAYARAFRQSKIAMIENGLHPYYWAAFVLSGL